MSILSGIRWGFMLLTVLSIGLFGVLSPYKYLWDEDMRQTDCEMVVIATIFILLDSILYGCVLALLVPKVGWKTSLVIDFLLLLCLMGMGIFKWFPHYCG